MASIFNLPLRARKLATATILAKTCRCHASLRLKPLRIALPLSAPVDRAWPFLPQLLFCYGLLTDWALAHGETPPSSASFVFFSWPNLHQIQPIDVFLVLRIY